MIGSGSCRFERYDQLSVFLQSIEHKSRQTLELIYYTGQDGHCALRVYVKICICGQTLIFITLPNITYLSHCRHNLRIDEENSKQSVEKGQKLEISPRCVS